MADATPLILPSGGEYSETAPHQGHRICCSCCDSKRGTIIVNVFVLIFAIIDMTSRAVMYNDTDLEKKVVNPENLDLINQYYVPGMVVDGVTIAVAFAIIFGANIYNVYLVGTGALWHVARLIFGVVIASKYNIEDSDGNTRKDLQWLYVIGPVVWTLFILYPMVVFISEVRSGIMSPHTYPRERHSCCGCY